mgnify:FL=1
MSNKVPGWRQARWEEPIVFELGAPGRRGFVPPRPEPDIVEALGPLEKLVPPEALREKPPSLPELSEPEVVRHFTRLSQMNYCPDLGLYPLGSCTMKYNPKVCDEVASLPQLRWAHPCQDERTVQGLLAILYELKLWLAEITGTYEVSLLPSAGAHGEFLGCLIVRAYHKRRGELSERREMVVPDSAHGTNPASAAMAGFKVITVPSGPDGCVDIEALKAVVSRRTAGLMLTNPNTLGIFETRIKEVAEIIHDIGGLLYYDGANLNAILGITRPGDMGFDIVHMNLHKTFGTPHGGGGPGSGPVGVVEELEPFLPVPRIEYDGKRYYLEWNKPLAVAKIRAFLGNVAVLLRAYAYILALGPSGLKEVAEISVLNSNYLLKRLSGLEGVEVPYGPGRPRKHEFVVSLRPLERSTGVRALNVAKRLLDHGLHAPTIYFPPIVEEAFMIEPTEAAPLEDLDRYAEAMRSILAEAREEPEKVLGAPYNTSVRRVDEVRASHPRTMALSWRMLRSRR